MTLPVLYSFRRCPYAIRARMAIAYACARHQMQVELREIILKEKPEAMLQASPKGTVPVLVLSDGEVIDESYDVMQWALTQSVEDDSIPVNIDDWWQPQQISDAEELIAVNDGDFKKHLDHYKYADRFPDNTAEHYRSCAEEFLQTLECRLSQHGYLLGERCTVADVAIFPFIRQFAFVDKPWFDQSPYPCLQRWLAEWLESPWFLAVMQKYQPWQVGDSPVLFPDRGD